MTPPHIIIFTGPTIAHADAAWELDAHYLPPAAQGDLYRAALRRPVMIGLIDGFFDLVPAVWHKEVLWAMHQGIHVFGSASMGALRAAELHAFGMEGVGAIFEEYCAGRLTADDAVAVIHGSAEHGFRPLSVALVNIQATLARAVQEQVLDPACASALAGLAQRRFYAERSYPALLDDGVLAGLPDAQLAGFRQWLPEGQVDQKRADAIAMLQTMRARMEAGLSPKKVLFSFEETDSWRRLVRSVERPEG
jgi:hypothetical protein